MKLIIAATNTLISLLCAVIILKTPLMNNASVFMVVFAVLVFNILNLCYPAQTTRISLKHFYYGLNGLIFTAIISGVFIITNFVYVPVYLLSEVISLGLIITFNEYQAFWPYENTKIRLFKLNQSTLFKTYLLLLASSLLIWLVYLKG